ncbi:MAG: hypothetical protein Q8Q96_00800 [bacterium]|nr:hypothetical protein [bacterium]
MINEISRRVPSNKDASPNFCPKPKKPTFVLYTIASGYPETPRDVAAREEKTKQMRQGTY